MAQYGLDWSPMLNVLGRLQQDRQFQQSQAENQRQFNAQNMLAQGRFNREGEALARAEAQRGQIRNLLAGGQGFENVPQPVRSIVGVTGDATPIVDYTIAEAKRKSESAVDPSSVREWRHFNAMSPEDQQRYLTMKRAERYLDTGTGYVRPNPAIPGAAPTPVVAKDIAGKEQAEELGKARGKAVADLPRVLDNATQAIDVLDKIEKHPALPYAVGAPGMLPTIPGTQQADVRALIDQLAGKAFLEAFNSLKGGGQITEAEGKKATDAIARLSKIQSLDGYKAALRDIRGVIEMGRQRAQKAADLMPPPPTRAVPQPTIAAPPGYSIKRID